MSEPNVLRPDWDAELPEPFRFRALRAGAHAGATELGLSLYELDPGGAVSPYHLHHANEELLVVLSGTPTLRTPAGIRELEPGAVVAFARGADGAHQIANASAEPARVLLISTMRFPEVAEHLDTGTLLAMSAPGEGQVFPAGSAAPPMEMLERAMRAGREAADAG